MKTKRFFLFLVLLLSFGGGGLAGAVPTITRVAVSPAATAQVIYAASCYQQDVQAAIDQAHDGDTVLVPAGTCTWTAPADAPAVVIHDKAITLRGSGPESTIINDNTGTSQALRVNGVLGKPFRITGFRFVSNRGENEFGGGINIGGTAMAWRVDHCEFISNNNRWSPVFVSGYSHGVVHDCLFHNSRAGTVPIDGGHNSWKLPLNLGGASAVYVENCRFEMDRRNNAIDTNHGGRYVFRYNTVINSYCEAHSLQNAIAGYPYGFARATRSYEIYNNRFEAVDNNPSHYNWVAVFVRGGTGVVFNNSVENLGGPPYSLFGVVDNRRSVETLDAPLLRCDGTNPLDGNVLGNGYPCLDQIGRSTDAGPGDQFHPQDLEPLYSWNNTLNGQQRGLVVHNDCGHHIQEGRDFYNYTPRPRYVPYPYPHPLTLADYPGEQRALELQGWTSPGRANLSWQAVTGAVSYRVVRGWNETAAVTTTATLYNEPWVGPEHVYMVYALDGAGKVLAAEGVFVAPAELTLHGRPADRAIHLTWETNATLPATATWQIDYTSQTVSAYLPITGIISPTRAHTLTDLTNGVWYTVTLSAMQGSAAILTDAVRVMPTDKFVYLPLVLRAH